jgi:hypothetical protein
MTGDQGAGCGKKRAGTTEPPLEPVRIAPAIRLLKNAHLLRFSRPSSLRHTSKYASRLGILRAPVSGISQSSTCILAFLNSLQKAGFSAPRSTISGREIRRHGTSGNLLHHYGRVR